MKCKSGEHRVEGRCVKSSGLVCGISKGQGRLKGMHSEYTGGGITLDIMELDNRKIIIIDDMSINIHGQTHRAWNEDFDGNKFIDGLPLKRKIGQINTDLPDWEKKHLLEPMEDVSRKNNNVGQFQFIHAVKCQPKGYGIDLRNGEKFLYDGKKIKRIK
jgi:hypothetical protein